VASSVKSISRALLPWVITAATLGYVFGYAIDWKTIPEATSQANLPLFLAITVFDKIVFFLIWTFTQHLTVQRFIEPVEFRQVLAVKGGSELLRSVNNSLADATFFFGISQIAKRGMSAVVAVAFIPFGAHFSILLLQATIALPFLPGDLAENRDVGLLVLISWGAVAAAVFAIRRGYVQRLLRDAGAGEWLESVTWRKLMPIVGFFALFAVFDIIIQGAASRAFGTEISWIALAGRIPILYLAISIPSLGNFGTREIAWANLFEGYGEDAALYAFALWTNVIFLVMHALIGALFFSRAITLIRGVRQARQGGEEIRRPLLRDAADR
jgi:hypothetical protein